MLFRINLSNIYPQVGYVPIPRIEYTDDGLDLVIENLALSGRNLFPNIVSMEAHNFVKFSPYNAITFVVSLPLLDMGLSDTPSQRRAPPRIHVDARSDPG